jgi:hypothetical protein
MEIAFVSTIQDFINSQRTHAWRRYSPERAKLQRILSPIFGAVFIVVGLMGYRQGWNVALVIFEVMCGLYVALSTSVIAPLLYRRAYRRRHCGSLHENIIRIADDAIYCDCPGHSHGTLEWNAIHGIIESDTTILLYLAPGRFLPIPKRVISDSDRQELLTTIRSKGVPFTYPKPARE